MFLTHSLKQCQRRNPGAASRRWSTTVHLSAKTAPPSTHRACRCVVSVRAENLQRATPPTQTRANHQATEPKLSGSIAKFGLRHSGSTVRPIHITSGAGHRFAGGTNEAGFSGDQPEIVACYATGCQQRSDEFRAHRRGGCPTCD